MDTHISGLQHRMNWFGNYVTDYINSADTITVKEEHCQHGNCKWRSRGMHSEK